MLLEWQATWTKMDRDCSTPKVDNQKCVDRRKFASKRRRKRKGFCVRGAVKDDCSAVNASQQERAIPISDNSLSRGSGPRNIRPTSCEGEAHQLTCDDAEVSDDNDESQEELEEIINISQEKLKNSSFSKDGVSLSENQNDDIGNGIFDKHKHNIIILININILINRLR